MKPRIIFGQADQRDYMEPLCECGHMLSEHYDGNGSEPSWPRRPSEMYPCWADWEGSTEGCECLDGHPRDAEPCEVHGDNCPGDTTDLPQGATP